MDFVYNRSSRGGASSSRYIPPKFPEDILKPFSETHYGILEPILPRFFELCGVPGEDVGMQSAHGDKVLQYRKQCSIEDWELAALYYLTYTSKYGKESRETKDGWVAPIDWVNANYDRFADRLHQAFNEQYQVRRSAIFGKKNEGVVMEERVTW